MDHVPLFVAALCAFVPAYGLGGSFIDAFTIALAVVNFGLFLRS